MALNNLGLGFIFSAKDLASPTMDRIERNFTGLDHAADKAQKRFERSATLIAGGTGLIAGGFAALAALKPAAEVTNEYEAAITEVTTLMRDGSFATADMIAMTKEAASAFGGSPVEQAKALYDIVSAGATDAAEANRQLAFTNKLAIAGVANRSQAFNALSKAMENFGGTAEEAGDSMFVAVQKGKTTLPEMARGLANVAQAAATAGLSLDETNAALSTASLAMPNTIEASSALKQAFFNIAAPTETAKKEAKKLGIELGKTAIETLGVVGTFKQFAGLDADAFRKLFDSSEARQSIGALLAKMGTFESTLTAMKNKAGAVDEAFAKMNETLKVQLLRFEAQVQVMQIAAGQALAPLIEKALDFAQVMLDVFNALPKEMRDFTIQAIAVAAVASVVVGGILFAVGAFAMLAPAIATAVGVISGFIGAFIGALPVIAATAAGIVLAVMAIKAAFDKNIGGIADFTKAAFDKIKLAFEVTRQLFSQGFITGKALEDLQKPEHSGLLKFFGMMARLIFRTKKLVVGIGEGIGAAFQRAKPVTDALRTSFERLSENLGGLAEIFGFVGKGASDGFQDLGQLIGGALGTVLVAVVDAFGILTRFVAGFLGGAAEIGRVVGPIFEDIGNLFSEIGSIFKDVLVQMGIMEELGTNNSSAWETFGAVLGTMMTVAIVPLAAVLRFVLEQVRDLGQGILDTKRKFDAASDGLADFMFFVDEEFTSTITGAWKAIREAFDKFMAPIGDVFDLMVDEVEQGINRMLGFIAEVAAKIPETFRPQFLDDFIAQQKALGNAAPGPARPPPGVAPGGGGAGFAFAGVPPQPAFAGAGGAIVQPGAAAFGGPDIGAQVAAAVQQVGNRPIVVQVDGRTIATANARGARANAAAEFGATPGVGDD